MKDIPLTGFYFDAGTEKRPKHDYYLDGVKMTGCTTVLGVLNKPALVPWSARMAVEYIKENADQVDIEAGFDEETWTALLEGAKTAYAKKRDDGAKKGTDTHALVEEYIKRCLENNGGKIMLVGNDSIQPFIDWAIANVDRFLGSEVQLYSKNLFVAGTADFIFEKDGKTYIGDIKTYKKIWDRTPFYQCAGYGIMWEEMQMNEEYNPAPTYEERVRLMMKEFKINKIAGYAIFNLPKEREHDPAQDILWSFDIEGDKRAFLACVDLYRLNNRFMKYTDPAPINKEDV